MRVLIISDTHGRHTAFDRAIMEAGKIDYLVHLGDTEGGEDYIEAFCGCPAYILAGNNDIFSRNLREPAQVKDTRAIWPDAAASCLAARKAWSWLCVSI